MDEDLQSVEPDNQILAFLKSSTKLIFMGIAWLSISTRMILVFLYSSLLFDDKVFAEISIIIKKLTKKIRPFKKYCIADIDDARFVVWIMLRGDFSILHIILRCLVVEIWMNVFQLNQPKYERKSFLSLFALLVI